MERVFLGYLRTTYWDPHSTTETLTGCRKTLVDAWIAIDSYVLQKGLSTSPGLSHNLYVEEWDLTGAQRVALHRERPKLITEPFPQARTDFSPD